MSDRKRNKERMGGCVVDGAWNHVKKNTSVSQLVSKPSNYGYKGSVYKVHAFICIAQRFSNFFQVGTTFISQNVLLTTLLLGLSNSLGLP